MPQPSLRGQLIPFSPIRTMFRLADEMERAGGGPVFRLHVGDPDFAPVFEARRVAVRPIRVDDAPKLAESGLARRIAGCPIREPGVSVA